MKIEKGYTLSQFVDLIFEMSWNEFSQRSGLNIKTPDLTIQSFKFILIIKYNDFLKQPLIKEMFVNEIEKPDVSLIGGFATNEESNEYEDALKVWQEAKKKVIFKGFSIAEDYTAINSMATKDHLFHDHISILNMDFIHEFTIADLINECNDYELELELQNVEI